MGKNVGIATIVDTPVSLSKDSSLKNKNAGSGSSSNKSSQEKIEVVGDVRGKYVLIVNQLIDAGDGIDIAVEAVMDAGAKDCAIFACHFISTEKSLECLKKLPVSAIVTLDTLPLDMQRAKEVPNLTQLSIAPDIGRLIASMHFESK